LTKLQIANVEPTGLVINPADAEVLDLLTDGEVRGYWGGPVQSGSSPVWSVPVVVTPVIAAGAALMGDFAGSARIFSREEAVVDFTEALGFKSNTVTFRAEARVGVGVLRPLAFVEVDLTA
jgi:HK97 family phage major capsid protein